MHRNNRYAVADVHRFRVGGLIVLGGCASRGVASGPADAPGTATWIVVWLAVALAAGTIGALLTRVENPPRGGARLAWAALATSAGTALVGSAVLAGVAIRSSTLADAAARGEPLEGTSLLRLSVIDGDVRFYSLMLLLVGFLGGGLVLLLTLAARFARGADPVERWIASAVLMVELGASAYALARVVDGERAWPYLVAAIHLPLLALALAACWPRRSQHPRPQDRVQPVHA